MGFIYKIENKINKKVYIGKTIRDVNTRFAEHIYYLNSNTHYNKHLQNAWNKYGGDNFDFSVVSANVPDELLDNAEINCIALFDSFRNGYNLTLGGEGTKTWTEYTIAKKGFRESGKQNYTIYDRKHKKLIQSIDYDKLEYIVNILNENEKKGLELIKETRMFKYTIAKAGFHDGKQMYIIYDKNNKKLIQSIDYDKLKYIAKILNEDDSILKNKDWKKILTKNYKESGNNE